MPRDKKKLITVEVQLSVPKWLSKAAAKREVRALINEQCFYGHRKPGTFDEIDEYNFRAKRVS